MNIYVNKNRGLINRGGYSAIIEGLTSKNDSSTNKEDENPKESYSTESLIKKLNDFPMKKGNSKVEYEDIKKIEAILAGFPIGTVISHKVDCGIEKYEKIEKNTWKHFWPIDKTGRKQFSFDTARWMAGLGIVTRGPFVLEK